MCDSETRASCAPGQLRVMLDIHYVNKVYSEQMQSDSSCCWDMPPAYDHYIAQLEKMRDGHLGPEARKRLPSVGAAQRLSRSG